MKLTNISMLLISFLVISPSLVNAQNAALIPQKEIQQARSLVQAFGSDLKSTLMTTMKTAGPIKAVEVCNTEAGPIAHKNSALSDWRVNRTSLKIRNTKNTPDEWELSILEQFEQRKAAGESVQKIEYFEEIKQGSETIYRYMKPIPTAGACLVCHGQQLDENIADKIHTLYPNDKATGYTINDIRGAFTLQKIIR